MKKIFKIALTAAISCVMAAAFSVCAYAEDVELTVENAKPTNGAWGQSICYYREQPVDVEDDVDIFDCGRITPDTVVYVEYELDGEWTEDRTPVELILQNYTSSDPQIWAKIEPFEWDETSASFDYQSIVEKYGSDDLSTVDNLWLGDTGIVMTVTKFTLTNCLAEGEVFTASETEAETEQVTETEPAESETTPAPETEATTAAAAESESGGGVSVILIILVAVAAVAVIAVVVIAIIKKNQNRFY